MSLLVLRRVLCRLTLPVVLLGLILTCPGVILAQEVEIEAVCRRMRDASRCW